MLELDGYYPGVQRLQAVATQLRAHSGPFGQLIAASEHLYAAAGEDVEGPGGREGEMGL